MRLEDHGVIGNCQLAAHVRRDGAIVWCCAPRFDSPPVFGALLDAREGGHFSIGPADGALGEQSYLANTNVLETRFHGPDGSFRVIDFAPRFEQHARSFRPTKLVRVVEPLSGTPRIRIRCEPVLGWSKVPPRREEGSHHVAFHGFDVPVRLTTDVPLSYLNGEPFALTGRRNLVFSWGAPVEEPLAPLCDRFLTETVRYWRQWVKRCRIPPSFAEEVVRSALVLKLHCFEDTGAIVAALTTSLPEVPGAGRTWDYRYCWLRDAYYVLGAFGLLGYFEEREQFLEYLLNVASSAPGLALAPLHRIDGRSDLDEEILPRWAGYEGEGPVRIGNGAARHEQHDVFGEMVLALTPLFLDARFRDQVSPTTLDLVEALSQRGIDVAGRPDAGIWELRAEWRPQTFSTMMCWAGADRMAEIARRHRPGRAAHFAAAAERIRAEHLERAVDPVRGCLVAYDGTQDIDAALLQAVSLGVWPRDDPRLARTVEVVQAELAHAGWLRRYAMHDGLGVPSVAFTLCTFWLVEALARLGRDDEARQVLHRIRAVRAPLGLWSEDLDPIGGRMWGNYPQAYSHVGLVHAAFAVAPRWPRFGP